VLLDTPNFWAAARTVALCAMMYFARSQARSSMFVLKNTTPANSHYSTVCLRGRDYVLQLSAGGLLLFMVILRIAWLNYI